MTLPYGWLVSLNKGHFQFKSPADDPVAYARWEFTEGKKVWERFFASRVDLDGKDILDLACGPGGKTCHLATLAPGKLVGVDLDPDLIRQAELARPVLTPPGLRVNLEFACVDATDLPFPSDYFDIITCSDAFEHFNKPREVLSEAIRVLKSGGIFCIDFAQWGAYNGHHLGDFLKTPWSHIFWSKEAVSSTVEELARLETQNLTDLQSRDNLQDLVKRRLKHFQNSLNGLRLGTFEKYIREESDIKVRWRKRTSAYPVLWPLIFLPCIRELAVARNVYILEKG